MLTAINYQQVTVINIAPPSLENLANITRLQIMKSMSSSITHHIYRR